MVIEVSNQASHTIDGTLEVEGRGLSLHTWGVADALTWKIKVKTMIVTKSYVYAI
jgi:hypothetical protein